MVCDDGSGKSATQRAYHPEELKIKENLKIDYTYYLAQQIHPVVSRICEPIEGIDAYQIAQWLDLDTNSFKKPVVHNTESVGHNITRPEVKFRDVTKFSFRCLQCRTENTVNGAMNGDVPFVTQCSNGDCNARPMDYLFYVKNQLSSAINSYITKYYQNKLICENPICTYETYRLPLNFMGKYPVCPSCKNGVMYREYTDHQLFSQLSYFLYIFDLNSLAKRK